MVRGHPHSLAEAEIILDDLVRKAFLFLNDHQTNVVLRQPDRYRVKTDYDRELTDALVKAELLSNGYVAVLSGATTIVSDSFESGVYRLVVYNTGSGFEHDGENANLHIKLRKGTLPGILNAVGAYTVQGSGTVIFEEAQSIMEGVVINPRPISIAQLASATLEVDTNRTPDVYLFGIASNGKSLLGIDGKPVAEYLFPQHRLTLDSLPPGTIFQLDPNNDRVILAYKPKS